MPEELLARRIRIPLWSLPSDMDLGYGADLQKEGISIPEKFANQAFLMLDEDGKTVLGDTCFRYDACLGLIIEKTETE